MFSARHLLKKAHQTFGPFRGWTHRKVLLYGLGWVILFSVFWTISALGALRTFVPNTFQITGLPGSERTYLVLLQNNAELRATGGFISAFALMDFKNGFPVSIEFQDVYGEIDDHGYMSPPYPMDILLEKDSEAYNGYSFRDANFNPDFTEATKEVLKFFHLTHPAKQVDGVVAINFSVLESIVNLYEPLHVDGEKFTKNNLFETLENSVSDIDRHNIEALAGRKNIIKDFAYSVIHNMVFKPWKWRELSEVLTQSLNEKEILVAFTSNPSLAGKIKRLGWDGSFPSPNKNHPMDVLAVNISNFGGMKSDRYLTRDVHYAIELTDQKDAEGNYIAYADLEVTLRHRGDYNTPLSGEYKGYLRAFAPMGTELLESSTGASYQEFIANYVGWGDTILMQPGEVSTYTYRFRLAPGVFQKDQYNLHLVKQPGTARDYYDVTVKSPIGGNLRGSRFDTHENVAFFQSNLTHDMDLKLTLLPDELPPRLFWQEIADLNVIELTFAEPMDASFAEDPLNYEIFDLNVNVPELDDGKLFIDFIEVRDGALRIFTRGMNPQPEEHYQVQLRNLRDNSGNPIRPNPRTVTVVQRLGVE